MAVVALTPRVRTIVVCDDVSVSLIEDRVFTLRECVSKSSRQRFRAGLLCSFSWLCRVRERAFFRHGFS